MSIHLPSMAYCVYKVEQGYSMGSVVRGKDVDIYSEKTEKQNPWCVSIFVETMLKSSGMTVELSCILHDGECNNKPQTICLVHLLSDWPLYLNLLNT